MASARGHRAMRRGLFLCLAALWPVCGQKKDLVHGKLIEFPMYPLKKTLTREPWMIRQDELERQLLIPPLPCWAHQMRAERSMRILVLGGSNTAQTAGPPQDRTWADFLHESLATEFPQLASFECWNYGVRGSGPTATLYTPYIFESKPASEWPNLVIMEFNINCESDEKCAEDNDAVRHTLNTRWAAQGLNPPSYLFIELFNFGGLYNMMEGKENTKKNRHDVLVQMDKKTYRNPHLTAIARFFRIPMLSFADVASPAVFRHFMHANLTDMWPYSHEGCHLNQFGHKFVCDYLLVPFLQGELSPHKEEHSDGARCSPYDSLSLSYFEPARYREYSSSSTWSLWNEETTLLNIVATNSSSDWRVVNLHGHEDGNHQCYGSTVANSTVGFHIVVPKACGSQQQCVLSMDYIHSWNTSYIGDALCSMHRTRKVSKRTQSTLVAVVRVTSNVHGNAPVKDTTPRKVTLLSNISVGGHYAIECAGIDTDRLSCISGMLLTHSTIKENH